MPSSLPRKRNGFFLLSLDKERFFYYTEAKLKTEEIAMKTDSRLTDISRIGVPCQKTEEGILFRLFPLEETPRFAVLRLCAEGPCAVYVNGSFAGGHKGRLPNRVLSIEISSLLQQGENEIRIHSVAHYLQSTARSLFEKRDFHFCSVAAEITAQLSSETIRIPTDGKWQCQDGSAPAIYSPITRKEYERFWIRSAIWPEKACDSQLPQAIGEVAGEAYRSYAGQTPDPFAEPVSIYASDVLPSLHPEFPRPETVEEGEHYAIFDFSRIVVGYPVLHYESREDLPVTLYFDYSESPKDFSGDTSYAKITKKLSLHTILPAAACSHQWIRRRAARYVLLRFPAEGFTLKKLQMRVSMLPSPRKGWFSCQDALLNRMWEVGKYTLEINKHQEYESCPRYEMKFFSGDGIMDALVDYCAFGDYSLADASLSYTEPYISVGLRPDVLDRNAGLWDYPAWRVIMSYNHYFHSGDEEFLSFYYEELAGLAEWMLEKIGHDDLVCQHPVYFDVFYTVPDATEYSCSEHRLGRKTHLNALFYQSFSCMAKLGRHRGDPRAEEWEEQAQATKAAINRLLWKEELGAYCDLDSPHRIPQEGNALAVLFGIADQTRARTVLTTLKANNWSPWGSAIFNEVTKHTRGGNRTVSPLMCTYEAEARFLQGDHEGAMELLRRCWGTMLKKGAESFWEFTYNHPEEEWPIRAHSWSAGCTYLLSSYGAGLRPKEKGYETLLFAPCPLLSDFICVLPTPRGYVAAKAETAEGILRYTLVLPKGMKHSAKLPEKALLCIKEY